LFLFGGLLREDARLRRHGKTFNPAGAKDDLSLSRPDALSGRGVGNTGSGAGDRVPCIEIAGRKSQISTRSICSRAFLHVGSPDDRHNAVADPCRADATVGRGCKCIISEFKRKGKRMKHQLKNLRSTSFDLPLHSTLMQRPMTISEAMPRSHRSHRDWTNECAHSQTAKSGPRRSDADQRHPDFKALSEPRLPLRNHSSIAPCQAPARTCPSFSREPQECPSLRQIPGTKRRKCSAQIKGRKSTSKKTWRQK
jgi:hypothetical protein